MIRTENVFVPASLECTVHGRAQRRTETAGSPRQKRRRSLAHGHGLRHQRAQGIAPSRNPDQRRRGVLHGCLGHLRLKRDQRRLGHQGMRHQPQKAVVSRVRSRLCGRAAPINELLPRQHAIFRHVAAQKSRRAAEVHSADTQQMPHFKPFAFRSELLLDRHVVPRCGGYRTIASLPSSALLIPSLAREPRPRGHGIAEGQENLVAWTPAHPATTRGLRHVSRSKSGARAQPKPTRN